MIKTATEKAWVPAIMALLLIAVFWPVSSMQFTIGSDFTAQTYPWLQFMSDSFRSGCFPLWCPYQNLGYPFYADPQSGFFYPPAVFLSLLPINLQWCQFYFIGHVIMAAIGFRHLLISLGRNVQSATVLGLVYAMSGLFIGNASHAVILQSYCWIPFLLAAYRRFWNTASWPDAIATALFAFLNICGGYMGINLFLFYTLVAMASYFSILKYRHGETLRPFLLRHFFLIGMFALLAAGWIFSIGSAWPLISRSAAVTVEQANSYSISPLALCTAPFVWLTVNDHIPFGAEFTMRSMGLGVFVTLFAVAGFWYAKFRSKWTWLLFLTVAFMMALGSFTPVRAMAYHYLPGFNLSRHAGVLRVFVVIPLLLFAEAGWHFFFSMEGKKHFQNWLLVLLVILVLPMILLWFSGAHLPSWKELFNEQKTIRFLQQCSATSAWCFALCYAAVFVAVAICATFLKTQAPRALLFLIVAEVAVATHYTFFATIETAIPLKAVVAQLPPRRFFFPIPENDPLDRHNQWTPESLHPVIWQANGFYQRMIPFDGYDGFELKWAQQLSARRDYWKILNSRKLFFSDSGKVSLIAFTPNSFSFKTENAVVLHLSQFAFPGWQVRAAGNVFLPKKDSLGFLEFSVPSGCERVDFEFDPKGVIVLWWLSMTVFCSAVIFLLLKSISKNNFSDSALSAQIGG